MYRNHALLELVYSVCTGINAKNIVSRLCKAGCSYQADITRAVSRYIHSLVSMSVSNGGEYQSHAGTNHKLIFYNEV